MSVSYKAGDPIKHEDLKVGMLVNCKYFDLEEYEVTGRIAVISDNGGMWSKAIGIGFIGGKANTYTVAEDWSAKPVLPEVEGLYLASYTGRRGEIDGDRDNALGEWGANPSGVWYFRPFNRSPFHLVGAGRITSLIAVDVVPEEALKSLADFYHDRDYTDPAHDVLTRFFNVVNRVNR